MIDLREACIDDVDGIVAIVKQSFQPKILGCTIYGCFGVGRFLADQLKLPKELRDTLSAVALDKNKIVGYIELRIVRNSVFLNYVCTHPEFRSRGLGMHLLRFSLASIRSDRFSSMVLDVFDDNSVAKDWYGKLGFSPIHFSAWYSIPLNSISVERTGIISGGAQADLCFREYGFSQFTVQTIRGQYEVGMLGEKWFRITQADVLDDPDAENALQLLDPKRKLLALLGEEVAQGKLRNAEKLIRTIRMRTEMSALIDAMDKQLESTSSWPSKAPS